MQQQPENTQTQQMLQLQRQAQARVRVRMQASALAQARVHKMEAAEVQVRAEALARAKARAEALVRAEARAEALVEAVGVVCFVDAHPVTYGEVLADSELMDIITSIKPEIRHYLARQAWHLSERWWFIQIIAPITRLPPDLLHQILLIIIDDINASHSHFALMRVSKHWNNIITGSWVSLKLGTTTPRHAVTRKLERDQWLLDVGVDTEIDRSVFTPSEGAYQTIFAAIQAASRRRSPVVKTLPAQADLPEHLVNSGLQQCTSVVMGRPRRFKIKCPCPCETSLLQHLFCILGTAASGELITVEMNSATVISFLAPTYSSIFRSVTVLSLDNLGGRNPVDLLPHLYQLDTFTASHLSLPVYPNDANLPLVHTLRHLSLRAVSIQWMSGRTFHALESCTLHFPLHRHILHTFNTALPNCKDLIYQGYPLDILNGILAQNLTYLTVKCSYSEKSLGGRQLVQLASHALRENRLAPRILHISIEAMNEAWMEALTFMSNLEELVIDNAQPSSLGVTALQAFVVHSVHSNNQHTTATQGGRYTPLCPSLKRFGLRYRRWLRPSEHFDLIPELVAIILSRQQSKFSLQSFHIWKESGQTEPLELIEGSWISLKAFERLTDDGAITGADLLRLVASRLAEKMFKPRSSPPALNCN